MLRVGGLAAIGGSPAAAGLLSGGEPAQAAAPSYKSLSYTKARSRCWVPRNGHGGHGRVHRLGGLHVRYGQCLVVDGGWVMR